MELHSYKKKLSVWKILFKWIVSQSKMRILYIY